MKRTRSLATAAAATRGDGSRNAASDFLGDVAGRLGISQDKLENAIQEATK